MNPPSRDELAGSLPPPVDGEPQELRRRIAAEIADHLACAAARESAEGADAEQTTRRVLSRFGDPVWVARKL